MNRIFFFIAIAILIAFLIAQFPYAVAKTDDKMQLVYSTLILSIVALGARSLPLSQTIKYSLVWLAVILLIVLGYSYKDTLLNTRIMAELLPNRARINAEGNIVIRASQNKHFHIEAKVNGVPVNFMIDTGASDVVLSKSDAERAGINTEELAYTRTYYTANGVTGGAIIKLKRLQIGGFILDDFPVSVNKGEMDGSLLGMSALRELGGFRIDGDEMVIGKD
ncbi:MAG: TIGR02281 family clan AA aspartic protease [Rickettsiales bacterium]